jgi:thiaminase/transcriptional activator TenA
MYANPDFAAVGAWLRAVVDDEAARMDDRGRQRLRDIFRTSSEYEWFFWQMAWTREAWHTPDETDVAPAARSQG